MPPEETRQLIISNVALYRYAAEVSFRLIHQGDIGGLENVTVLFRTGAFATIRPARTPSWEGHRRYKIVISGFRSAAEAEREGRRLAQALLLFAISTDKGVRLEYHGEEPCRVLDRTRSGGFGIYAEGATFQSQELVLDELVDSFSQEILDRRLFLSMELYSASLLEMTDRTRFIMIVSALEPLVNQENYGPEISAFIESAMATLDATDGIPESIRRSLRGRLDQMHRESIRQALHRLCTVWFPNQPTLHARIERAYTLRSELLHNGAFSDPSIDLTGEIYQITAVLRSIYERETGRTLRYHR